MSKALWVSNKCSLRLAKTILKNQLEGNALNGLKLSSFVHLFNFLYVLSDWSVPLEKKVVHLWHKWIVLNLSSQKKEDTISRQGKREQSVWAF